MSFPTPDPLRQMQTEALESKAFSSDVQQKQWWRPKWGGKPSRLDLLALAAVLVIVAALIATALLASLLT